MQTCFNMAASVIGTLWFMSWIQTTCAVISTTFTERINDDNNGTMLTTLSPDITTVYGTMPLADKKDCFEYVLAEQKDPNLKLVKVGVTAEATFPKNKAPAVGASVMKVSVNNIRGNEIFSFGCSVEVGGSVICSGERMIRSANKVKSLCIENLQKKAPFNYTINFSPSNLANEYWERQEGDTSGTTPPSNTTSVVARPIPSGKNVIKGVVFASADYKGDLFDCYDYKMNATGDVTIISDTVFPSQADLEVLVVGNGGFPSYTSAHECPATTIASMGVNAMCTAYTLVAGSNFICVKLNESPSEIKYTYRLTFSKPSA